MYPSTVYTTVEFKEDRYDYISCSTHKVTVPKDTQCVVLGTSFDPRSKITYLVVRPFKLTVRLRLAPEDYKEKL